MAGRIEQAQQISGRLSGRREEAGHGLAGILNLEIGCLRSSGKVIRRVEIYEDWRRGKGGRLQGACPVLRGRGDFTW